MSRIAKVQPAPSPFALKAALDTLTDLRQRLLTNDPDMAADERLLADMLEGEDTTEALGVLDLVIRASLTAASMADEAKSRADRLMERCKRYRAREDSLRAAAFTVLNTLEMRVHERADFTVAINAGRPSVAVLDVAKLPAEFVTTSVAPNKSLIGKALAAGTEVPGAELSIPFPTMTIRTR